MALRLSACGLGFILMTGCGGSPSGSGGSANPTTVTFTFNGQIPTAIATQIGSGAFTAETAGSSVSLSVPSGTTKFAVAYICPPVKEGSRQVTYQTVVESTVSEGTAYLRSCSGGGYTGTTGTLTGSVDASGIPDASELSINAQNSKYYAQAPYMGAVSNLDFAAPVGTDRVDLVAWNVNSDTGAATAVAAKSFTGQVVPGTLNGGNAVVLGAEDQVTAQSITYNNSPAGLIGPSSIVEWTPTGFPAPLLLADRSGATYPVLPAGVVQGGGTYEIASVSSVIGTAGFCSVAVIQKMSSAKAVTVDFPDTWSYEGPTESALPTINFSYSGFAGKPGVSQQAELDWLSGANTQSSYIVLSSADYMNGTTLLAIPNLSGISGFLAVPGSGTNLNWSVAMVQSDAGSLKTLGVDQSTRVVQVFGSYFVP